MCVKIYTNYREEFSESQDKKRKKVTNIHHFILKGKTTLGYEKRVKRKLRKKSAGLTTHYTLPASRELE